MTVNREDIESFAARLQEMSDDHFRRSLPILWENGQTNIFNVSYGKKYAKIYYEGPGTKSVHSFVDMSNGDILKPATWSKPAKHARGNINDEYQGMASVSPYNANYL